MKDKKLLELKHQAWLELNNHILPFWLNMADREKGGFYGRMDGNNNLLPDSPRGGILNARILWTFSSAYNLLKDSNYREAAEHSAAYILQHFFDKDFGGTFWSLNADGSPLDTKKQVYSQAFFIYALVEYYMATGEKDILEMAITLFHLIEKHSFDEVGNGYLEAFDQQWNLLDDLRLSEKDANEKKTMNTHLHILEAYTNLYRAWKNPLLEKQLHNLINLFLDHFISSHSNHLVLFFNDTWSSKYDITSYGHDIECSWLLYEAALVLNRPGFTEKVGERCLMVANAVQDGLQSDGSIIYEKDNASGHIDSDRHWWPQSEAVVGFFNAWELSKDQEYLKKAMHCFDFIQTRLVDPENGEWYWSIRADGSINRDDDKAGFWKCPYHNSRMCIELIRRISELTGV